jgi:putative DNA primase/helicase
LAQSDPRISITTDKLDLNPWALNFLNGTVDLRTGNLRPHRKEDFITKLVRCNYIPNLEGPGWLYFVRQTFGDLVDWIQKAVGYSSTGVTNEKAAFLLWGLTDTGKSTFLTILREVFANYSALIQIDTLMASKNHDNNTAADLADLRGARLAVTSETEEGARLREAKLKRITQGMGEIKTARKYENPVCFAESHKLWFDCNHQPVIRGVDDAIWNRIIIVPCTHQVSEAEKDRNLKAKLLHEAEAIASWTVAGAVRWYKEGLGRPKLILDTREQWRKDMDVIGQFIAECCVQDSESSGRANELYDAFKCWSEKQGYEHVITLMAFGLRLAERRGLQKGRDTKGVFYSGIKLKGGLF